MFGYYVYAYSMRAYTNTGLWCQLLAHRICEYHEDVSEASNAVTRLINEDWGDEDECFAVGSIPTGACHEHNLV